MSQLPNESLSTRLKSRTSLNTQTHSNMTFTNSHLPLSSIEHTGPDLGYDNEPHSLGASLKTTLACMVKKPKPIWDYNKYVEPKKKVINFFEKPQPVLDISKWNKSKKEITHMNCIRALGGEKWEQDEPDNMVSPEN